MPTREAVIIDSVRTGLAKSFVGKFNRTRPDDMVAHCVRALLMRNPHLDPAEVEDCIVGTGLPEGAQGHNIGRCAALLSGLPASVPGMTVNRYCASSLQAIAIAAHQIREEGAEVVLVGGVESITMVQNSLNTKDLSNPRLAESRPAIYWPMGATAEVVAERYGIRRPLQDAYALQSQQRTAAAQTRGLFVEEIVPMSVAWAPADEATGRAVEVEGIVDQDECGRPDATLETLSGAMPAFKMDGTVTAGNAAPLADGASMALLMSSDRARALDRAPLGSFAAFVVAGVEPDEMGIGPVPAVTKLLERTGLRLGDIDLFELNEAFASQVLYCRDRLGLDPEKLNVNGGAIAMGHPYGTSGSRLVGHLLRELRRREKRLGIVALCVAGGMGAAALFEANLDDPPGRGAL